MKKADGEITFNTSLRPGNIIFILNKSFEDGKDFYNMYLGVPILGIDTPDKHTIHINTYKNQINYKGKFRFFQTIDGIEYESIITSNTLSYVVAGPSEKVEELFDEFLFKCKDIKWEVIEHYIRHRLPELLI